MFVELTPQQSKVFIDAEHCFLALKDAQEKMRPYHGGMHWKTVGQQQYLYRTLDSKGTAKSLGRRSPETQAVYEQFHARREALVARMASLKAREDEHRRMVRALRVGRAPAILAGLCRAFGENDLLGKNVLIIGTNALYAYEAMAGVRMQSDILATQDLDVLLKHRSRLTAVARGIGADGLMGVLRRVDKTFEISAQQPYRAINADGFMVDLIRDTPHPPWSNEPYNMGAQDEFVAVDIPHMHWMLSVPHVRQVVAAANGQMFEMAVPDPRAFALFKHWLAQQPDRAPLKRERDSLQAQAVEHLLQDHLPQFPWNCATLKALPQAWLEDHVPDDGLPGPRP